jgi:arylsulfatase A-like enzyme/tetratricopeptide (TPR) repeat protein
MTRTRLLALAVTVAALVAGAALWLRTARSEPPASAGRPNIVLITIDTLRADRVGHGLTPAIDSLSAIGVTFDNARTAVPLTLPSHVTIMTGMLPPAHGVRQNGVAFRPGPPTLARLLRDRGYRTGAFVGAYVLDRRFGLADGFDTYDDRVPRDPEKGARLEAERRGGEVVDAALGWLREVREPFFAWVHVYDPHAPYDPPAEFLAKAGGRPYDGEVAYADAQVGRLCDGLRQRGLFERAVIAVTGDHGEGLGEHGEQTHGMLAYDTTLRVPLILVAPAFSARGRVSDPVSLADLAGSLLDIARIKPPGEMSGELLLSRKNRDVYSETEYPRTAAWHPIAALADDRWKLVLSSEAELYDLAEDPGETKNLASAKPALVDGMSKRVRELMRPAAGAPAQKVDPEVEQRLRALGYVSGSFSIAPATGPNPAAVIRDWTTFEAALGQLNGDRLREAVPALKTLATKFPQSPVFQSTYARALMETGHPRAAMEIYRAAVAGHPQDAMLFHDLAVAARAAGDGAEALRAEQAALALDKDNPVVLNGLGLVHVDAGRPAEAAAAFERAAALDRLNPSFWTNLGNARRALATLPAAETAYRRALEIDARYPDALNGLAVLLVQRGAAADAIPLLTLALDAAPDFHEARLNLGIAYQESGDRGKAAETYRRLLATAPPTASRERKAAQELLGQLR